jgi:hypothetical protein
LRLEKAEIVMLIMNDKAMNRSRLARVARQTKDMLRRETVEHPFGTIKA